MQYCSLKHWTYITSYIHNWALFLIWFHLFVFSRVISPLFSSSILGTYRPGEFIFQCHIFLPFLTIQGKNTEVACHSLLQYNTFCQIYPSWPSVLGALLGVAHSFIDVDKVVIHVVSFLCLLFSFCLPSDDGVEGRVLIFSKNSKTITRCWTTVNWRMLDLTKNRYSTSKGKGKA